ncbi:hypothetical protein ACHAPT_009181 [Fusarium lateritium]
MHFFKLICLVTASIATASPIADPAAAASIERRQESVACKAAREALAALLEIYWTNEAKGAVAASNVVQKLVKAGQANADEVC